MTDKLLSISAACLFDDQGNLLLVRKRGTQAFMLPGGKARAGRNALAALQRELLEELRLPMGASTFEHLGSFQAPAITGEHPRRCRYLRRPLAPRRLCAGGAGELAWLVPGQAQPDNLAPLLRDHVLPALARGGKTRKPRPNTGRAPIMCAER